jgi:hypothetical protein
MAGLGGMKATLRPELRERFADHVTRKSAWFSENCGPLGCVGCGRCIDSCLGRGDPHQFLNHLREVEA